MIFIRRIRRVKVELIALEKKILEDVLGQILFIVKSFLRSRNLNFMR